jgi:hypothetical protein
MNQNRNLILTLVGAVVITMLSAVKLQAQDTQETPLDTLTRSVGKLQDDFAIFKKIKISGYIQSQFQMIDSAGAPSFAGGNFAPGVDKRFAIRRGRLKFVYDNRLTQYVLQFNATETGVTTKEAYVKITEPWLEAFSVQMGIFDVPFGYEAPYSSSALETPERGRMSQTLLPDENDLGAMLTFQMPKTSPLNFLKLEAGVFNGTQAKATDFDFQKDFIGRLSVVKASKSEKIKYGFGTSFYDGGISQGNKYVYTSVSKENDIVWFNVDSTVTNKGKIAKREYFGLDAQVSFDFPFGITTLKAEYIEGVQPGSAGSSKSPNTALADAPIISKATNLPTTPAAYSHIADTYSRRFNGAYFYFIQNVGQTKSQIVVKYDWYDPNTKVSGDEIGSKGSKLGVADLKFSTLGIGYNYKWDNNVKITFYYDMVTNEKSKNLVKEGYWKDIPDNVFTLRFQYKF